MAFGLPAGVAADASSRQQPQQWRQQPQTLAPSSHCSSHCQGLRRSRMSLQRAARSVTWSLVRTEEARGRAIWQALLHRQAQMHIKMQLTKGQTMMRRPRRLRCWMHRGRRSRRLHSRPGVGAAAVGAAAAGGVVGVAVPTEPPRSPPTASLLRAPLQVVPPSVHYQPEAP